MSGRGIRFMSMSILTILALALLGCGTKAPQGAQEGAPFIAAQLIDVPKKAFDDFAGAASDSACNRRILGV